VARKKSPTLTEAELRLMEVLWEKGSATVNDVLEELPKRVPLAYNTVLTTLRILERKGYIRHEKDGRAFLYFPVINRGKARRNAVRYLVSRFFDNSPELLLLNVMKHASIDEGELKRLKKMIAENK
jgi:predicted transcriptional regulator